MVVVSGRCVAPRFRCITGLTRLVSVVQEESFPAIDPGVAQALPFAKTLLFGEAPRCVQTMGQQMFSVVAAVVQSFCSNELPPVGNLTRLAQSSTGLLASNLADVWTTVCAELAEARSLDNPLISTGLDARAWGVMLNPDANCGAAPLRDVEFALVLRLRNRVIGFLLPKSWSQQLGFRLVGPAVNGLFDGEEGFFAADFQSADDLVKYFRVLFPPDCNSKVDALMLQRIQQSSSGLAAALAPSVTPCAIGNTAPPGSAAGSEAAALKRGVVVAGEREAAGLYPDLTP